MVVTRSGRLMMGLQMAIFAVCAVSADPCRAEEEHDYARIAPYMGLALGMAHDTALEDEIEDLVGVNVEFKTSAALQAHLGYRVAPNLATELQLEYSPKFKIGYQGTDYASQRLLAFTANAKVPLSLGRLQPYALAGAGFLHARFKDEVGAGISFDDTDFTLRFAGGLDVYATENVSLGLALGYVLPFGDLEDVDYLSLVLGLQYHF